MEMNRDPTSVMLRGQRSISSSLRSRSSYPVKKSKEDTERNLSNVSAMSLSELFACKSVVPGTIKGKSRPFSSLLDSSGSIHEHSREAAQTRQVIDNVVFQQFKNTNIEKDERTFSNSIYEAEWFLADDTKESRKRKMLSEGEGAKHRARKHVVVIGGDSKPKQKARKNVAVRNTNTRRGPLYNHYANGSGWWDCDMEGIDSEDVGFGHVWEGVGSTTFGEI